MAGAAARDELRGRHASRNDVGHFRLVRYRDIHRAAGIRLRHSAARTDGLLPRSSQRAPSGELGSGLVGSGAQGAVRDAAVRIAPVVLFALASTAAHAGGLAIVGTELRDNGDHDGYADTNETVELWLTVKNTTATPLTGVTVQVSTSTPGVACVFDGTAAVGSIPAGAELRAAEPLVFHVGTNLDRVSLG